MASVKPADPRLEALADLADRDEEPGAALLEMMDGPAIVQPHGPRPGPEPEWSAEDLRRAAGAVLAAASVDALLGQARTRRGFTLRRAANEAGLSHPRVAQLERAGQRLEFGPLARYADALGFDLVLTLVDRQGGEPIEAPVKVLER